MLFPPLLLLLACMSSVSCVARSFFCSLALPRACPTPRALSCALGLGCAPGRLPRRQPPRVRLPFGAAATRGLGRRLRYPSHAFNALLLCTVVLIAPFSRSGPPLEPRAVIWRPFRSLRSSFPVVLRFPRSHSSSLASGTSASTARIHWYGLRTREFPC